MGWATLAKIAGRARNNMRMQDALYIASVCDGGSGQARGRNNRGRIAIRSAQLAFARVGRDMRRRMHAEHCVTDNECQQECDAETAHIAQYSLRFNNN